MNDRSTFLLNIQDFILNTKPAKYYTRAPPTLSDEKVSFTADGGWNIRRMGGKRIGRERDGWEGSMQSLPDLALLGIRGHRN